MKKAFVVIICLVVIIMVVVFAKVSRPTTTPVDTTANATQQAPVTTQTSDTTTTPTTSMDTSKTQKLDNGLEITVIKEGQGPAAKANDNVTVNYTGVLTNGTTFDSNVDPKFGHVAPFTFLLGAGHVIKGWDQGVLGMKVGEKRRLVIPAALGYGAGGAAPSIPPNATLVFDVEVTGINQ